MASRNRPRLACWAALTPSVAKAVALGEKSSKSVPMSTRHRGHCSGHVGQRHIDRAARFVALRIVAGLGHPGRVRHDVKHLDLHVVRPIAVPKDEHVPVRGKHLRGSSQPRSHRFVHQAASIGRVELRMGEVVRRRITQVDQRVGDNGAHVDESRCARFGDSAVARRHSRARRRSSQRAEQGQRGAEVRGRPWIQYAAAAARVSSSRWPRRVAGRPRLWPRSERQPHAARVPLSWPVFRPRPRSA